LSLLGLVDTVAELNCIGSVLRENLKGRWILRNTTRTTGLGETVQGTGVKMNNSSKQSTMAKSSTEAKYVALVNCTSEVISISQLIQEHGVNCAPI